MQMFQDFWLRLYVNIALEENNRLLRNRLRVTAAIRRIGDSDGGAGIVEKHFVVCIR